MVNLAFCKLDVPYLISSDNSEAHQSSISIFISLERDGHSCWNFGIDPLRASDVVLSKWLMVFLVICCSDFVSRRDLRFLLTLRVDQLISLILDHDPICWMLWYHDGFFQTTAGVGSDQGR